MKIVFLASVGIGFLSSLPAFSQTTTTPINSYPDMTGTASAPKEAKTKSVFSYPIEVTDRDTWNVVVSGYPPSLKELPDFNVFLFVTAIRSMVSTSPAPILSLRGNFPDGKTIWDVSGKAITVTEPTIRIDNFYIVNPPIAPLVDYDIMVSQVVLINLTQSGPGT